MGRVLAALLLIGSAQDRTDIPDEIDSWYTVVQGKKAVGYVHELMKRSKKPSGFDYLLESEIDLKPNTDEMSFTASLDETLAPTECAADAHANGFPSGFTMYTIDERRLEARRSAGDPILWVQPVRDDFYVLPSLTLYGLRQNGTFAKPGRTTLRAVDLRGLAKDGIEVILESGEPVKREFRGKERRLTPVTFLKPFPAPSPATEMTKVLIDAYGRIYEAEFSSGARMVMVDNHLEALAAVGSVRRQGRRDIFDKLAAMQYAARERDRARRGLPQIERPSVTVDSLMSDLEGVRKMADEIRAQKASGELAEARQTYLKMLVHLQTIRGLALRKRPEMIPQINEVRELAEQAWPGAANLRDEARIEFVKAKAHLENVDVEGMEATRKVLLTFLDRIEVEGRPERDEIARWAAEAGTLVVQCRTRRDLANARLDVSAITLADVETKEILEIPVRQEVLFIRPFAEAAINGQVYRPGDTIEGTKIKVEKITRHSVRVSLRDELREVPLRR
jgi:hypothetical protein